MMSITKMEEEGETTMSKTENKPYLTLEYRAIEEEFFNTYKNLPELWDTEHEHYSNKCKRDEAYDVLLKVLRKVQPSASRYDVRRKINAERTNYNKGRRRQLASKRIGINGEIVYDYTPTIWKFHALKFLEKNEKRNNNNEIEQILANNFEDDASYEETFVTEEPSNSSDVLASIVDNEPLPLTEIKCKKRVKPKKEKQFFGEDMIDRELKAIGANVICKLKRMNPEQRYHAELLINKVLISGLKNNLSDETDLTDVYKI